MGNAVMPTLTIAILSSQCLVWLGLQKILENSATVPMVVHPYSGWTSDLLRAERRPDVFILDLETERVGTITQIRIPPRPVRSSCCASSRTRTVRARRLSAASTASSSKFNHPPSCSR